MIPSDQTRLLLIVCAALGAGPACNAAREPSPSGAEEEGPALAITRWTNDYELFVELPAPVPGKPVPYHAHVTRLADFAAVTAGSFSVVYRSGDNVAATATQNGVKRPGIFVFEAPAPAAGKYTLEMSYEHDGQRDRFDCGEVSVSDPPVPSTGELPGAAITFLKESQWKIPFATAWAEPHPLSTELELAATLEPAGADQLTISAATSGRFLHDPGLALGEGLRIERGQQLGAIEPVVGGEDYSRLEFAVEEARLARDQLQREIERVEPLVKENLLPERRLLQLRNELATQRARFALADARLRRVVAPGSGNGIPVRAGASGVIAAVLVPNGGTVEAGAPLLRTSGTEHLWIRARFIAKPPALLADARPSFVRLPSGDSFDLSARGARFLSPLPLVDASSRIATWIVDVPQGAEATPQLRSGSAVVLGVRIGSPENVLAVRRGAVVDINTRPYVFVQLDGEHFEKRAVTLGRSDGPWTQLSSGVQPRERVVELGGYDIHLAALMGTIESHRH